jgi:hypothetical protein
MHLDIWGTYSTRSVPTPRKIAGEFLALSKENTFSVESMWNIYVPVTYVNILH